MNDRKVTIHTLHAMKQRGEKITALTAYDFFTAKIMDEVGVQLILVGDSLGMAVLGYENTLPVTMDEMIHHTKAVARAKPNALLVADMPFMSYSTVKQALENAGRLIQAGVEAVKLEGGEAIIEQVRALVAAGIPVLGPHRIACRSRFSKPAATRSKGARRSPRRSCCGMREHWKKPAHSHWLSKVSWRRSLKESPHPSASRPSGLARVRTATDRFW